jgi:hypothetical protein
MAPVWSLEDFERPGTLDSPVESVDEGEEGSDDAGSEVADEDDEDEVEDDDVEVDVSVAVVETEDLDVAAPPAGVVNAASKWSVAAAAAQAIYV